MSSTHLMTPPISSEDLVPTSVSTDLRLNDASSIFTYKGTTERRENRHTSIISDSPNIESSVQFIPHNEEAHQQGTSIVSE